MEIRLKGRKEEIEEFERIINKLIDTPEGEELIEKYDFNFSKFYKNNEENTYRRYINLKPSYNSCLVNYLHNKLNR